MTKLDPAQNGWLVAPATARVMAALKTASRDTDARFVGGAVRNALIGRPIDDIDIATPLPPKDVVRRLLDAGLKAVPTGIAHGTVTAVAAGKPFEITSLRRDVATDGRHATVAFGGSWAEDAQRRDFTMNALYATAEGDVIDTVGGVADLLAGRVRFVGDPATRICEDYLRILRLFRFQAWYGTGPLDPAALSAAVAAGEGLDTLSGERIAKEMLKLLAAPTPAAVLRQMATGGLLDRVLPGRADLDRLERLCALEARYGFEPDGLLRLAALGGEGPAIAQRWRLSKAQCQRLTAVAAASPLAADLPHGEARRRLYRLGGQVFRDRLFFDWAGPAAGPDPAWFALLELVELFEPPPFPLTGHDAVAMGFQGAAVGRALRSVKVWWIESDFRPGRDALLQRLQQAGRYEPALSRPKGGRGALSRRSP